MKKTLISAITGVLTVLALGVGMTTPLLTQTVAAQSAVEQGASAAMATDSNTCLFTGDGCENGIFTTIANTALFIIGALSVLMLIYGGIRYTISGGDTTAVTNAKNTIMYAIVGLVVALLAGAVVNFVLGRLITG